MSVKTNKLLLVIMILALVITPLRGAWAFATPADTGGTPHCAQMDMPSTDMPGRIGLWRRVGAGAYEELAAPFDSTARFRFLVGPNLLRTDTPPVDLTTVNGLELSIIAQSYEPPRGRTQYQTFDLPVQVVFLNKGN